MIMFLQSFDHYILTAINYTENISSRFSEEMFPQYHMHKDKDNFLHFCGNFIQMFEGYDHRSKRSSLFFFFNFNKPFVTGNSLLCYLRF